jgi:SAM-dependent methyltransferase
MLPRTIVRRVVAPPEGLPDCDGYADTVKGVSTVDPSALAAGGSDRVAAVDQLIEWTGERCVPWAPDAGVIYEHLHRYLFASTFVRGRRVLDLASGEGYGADILADAAADVVGIEIDPRAVEHARQRYPRSNLSFQVGSMIELDDVAAQSFDAVTCFEALEHIVEHEQLISQIDRVLAPGGIVIISTPDRRIHTEHQHQQNPFHLRELDQDEFISLLASRFKHLSLWGQRFGTVSLMEPLLVDPHGLVSFAVEKRTDGWHRTAETAPTYLIGVAARVPFTVQPIVSWLNDEEHEVLKALDTAVQRAEGAAALASSERDAIRREMEDRLAEMEDRLAAYVGHSARLEADLAAINASKGWRAILLARQVAFRLRAVTARSKNPVSRPKRDSDNRQR